MSETPVVVAAGPVPAFILADCVLAEMMAPLAQWTTPTRFQALIFELAARPDQLEHLKHKHMRLLAQSSLV